VKMILFELKHGIFWDQAPMNCEDKVSHK